jgi:phosphatidylserine/phosphatidylglycerophosphate/cardiolipin synthase-like enzyme
MSITVFLPIFKVQIEFQVKHGRRWTALEHLVLWVLSEERRTVVELSEGTAAPPRLIVECLINLMRVGWVEIQTSAEQVYFTINESGKVALEQIDLPYDFQFVRRFRTFYLERISDRMLRTEGIRVVHREKAKETAVNQRSLILEPTVHKATIRPVDVLDNLGLGTDDEFEMWLDHRVLGANLYAVLRVIGNNVDGIDNIEPGLNEAVLEAVDKMVDADRSPGDEPREQKRIVRLSDEKKLVRTFFSGDDLLVGGSAHFEAISQALGSAQSYVSIHSTFLSGAATEALIPKLEECIKRGVEIDILWGERDDRSEGQRNTSAIQARRLTEYFTKYQGKARVGNVPTGSHCKLVLSDSGQDGAFEALVGSCNWLSSNYSALDISVRLKDKPLVREVARTFATLQMPPSGRWDRAVMRAVRIAESCRNSSTLGTVNAGAMLVVDEEHYVAIREARDNASHEIISGCDWLGTAAETSIFVPARTAATGLAPNSIRLLYQRQDPRLKGKISEIRDGLIAHGVQLVESPNLHGKFLLWDSDNIVISSFNWLSTAIHAYSAGPSEMGILIQSPGVADMLKTRLCAAGCPVAEGKTG